MANQWENYNFRLCSEYKSIVYQLSNSDSFANPDLIDREFRDSRCSQALYDFLKNPYCSIQLFSIDNIYDKNLMRYRKRNASQQLRFWTDVLETYLNKKRDTPSCISLWRWAAHEHTEYQSLKDQLSKWRIQVDKPKKMTSSWILNYKAGDPTTYKAYSKMFERHIHTKPYDCPIETRKIEKNSEKLMKRESRSKK